MVRPILALCLTAVVLVPASGRSEEAAKPAASLLAGAWAVERRQELLGKVLTVRLAPDLSHLTAGERRAVDELLAVGEIFQRLYEEALHHQAAAVREQLAANPAAVDARTLDDLRTLFRLFQGPIATTLDNKREPFVGVDPTVPGRNMYPWGIEEKEVEAFLAAHPDRREEVLGERTVVRRATAASLAADRAALSGSPALGALHPGLAERLAALAAAPDPAVLYAVPQAVAWAPELGEAQRHLFRAADAVEADDPELARYLRNRGRDLLSNDYESGDASWVTGRFRRLNAQIGSYETYDDALFGVKAFAGLVPAAARREGDGRAGSRPRRAAGGRGRAAVRDAPPGARGHPGRRLRGGGRLRPGARHQHGDDPAQRRAVLASLRARHPDARERPHAPGPVRHRRPAMAGGGGAGVRRPARAGGRTSSARCGTRSGTTSASTARATAAPLDQALGRWADALEEMKADLVSLFAHHRFRAAGTASDERLRAVQASGILRTLQNNKPRADQPYQTMQLSQFNWFLDRGLLSFDAERRLVLHPERYEATVTELLREVLTIQAAGDPQKAEAFFGRWTAWTDDLHAPLAARLRQAEGPRFRLVRYGALGE